MTLAKVAQAMRAIKDTDRQVTHDQKGNEMKIGIVINSRLSSSRIPRKALNTINGIPMIQHLVSRLEYTKLPIFIAVPTQDYLQYLFLNESCIVTIHQSVFDVDPLARMNEVAKEYGLDYVVRINHDKIFIDTSLLNEVLASHYGSCSAPDYTFLSGSIPGTGFEIISSKAIADASSRFKDVEFIGYAIREVTKNIHVVNVDHELSKKIRLLVDYPNDISLMHVLMSQLGNDCTLLNVIEYLNKKSFLNKINRLPRVTVYTCAYNAEKWIQETIDSVKRLSFSNLEYIMIDDFSSDRTPEIMATAASEDNRFRFIRNDKNLGLSSSSNVALREARGEYIIRIDADDSFFEKISLLALLYHAERNNFEVVYPDYIKTNEDGSFISRHTGCEENHIGGAIFSTMALNYLKFTSGLRGHDSLDIWTRAKDLLKFGYLGNIVFSYRQHDASLTKNNLQERESIKLAILEGLHAKTSSNRSNEIVQSGVIERME